ncbi:hypothetical protein M427DRAFT_134108 [Gonapodya prolifera JEL478]|uniref:Transmembrane protein n=1 Tax=Gonapodya prolifera (strain JEL478) TaxID=1344416 RepID=A0A139AI69_GONPJ|nr:hypothetical protein M427DRAFT_134108 [Gonapodya prolifera JEL478]|eukprot:KXS16502.1 hypothetical protein M427DRAFT_134108 [Gonapodya prolifera JEL478]
MAGHPDAADSDATPDILSSRYNTISEASQFATLGSLPEFGTNLEGISSLVNTSTQNRNRQNSSSDRRPTSPNSTTTALNASPSTLTRSEITFAPSPVGRSDDGQQSTSAGRTANSKSPPLAQTFRSGGVSSGGRRASAPSVLDFDEDLAPGDIFGFGSSLRKRPQKSSTDKAPSARTGLLKDEIIPRTTRWALMSGISLAILQTLCTTVFASAVTATLGTLERIILKNSSNIPEYEYLPSLTLLLFSCLGVSLFRFWIYLSAISTGNQFEMIGHALLVLASIVLSALVTVHEISIHADYERTFPDLPIQILNDRVRNITIVNSVVDVAAGVAWILIDLRLYFHLGWRIYWRYGADPKSKLRHSFIHVFQVLLKLTSLVLVLNVFYFYILVYISGVFFLHPSTSGMYLFIFVTGAAVVYVVGSIAGTQYSPAYMIFFCLATCVEIIPLVQCAFSLFDFVNESPTSLRQKALPFIVIPQILAVVFMLAMVVIGGINTRLFFKYPHAGPKERHLSNVEWTLA